MGLGERLENGKGSGSNPSKHLMANISEHWVYLLKTMLKQINDTILNDDYSLGFHEMILYRFRLYGRLVETGPFLHLKKVFCTKMFTNQNPNWLNQNWYIPHHLR